MSQGLPAAVHRGLQADAPIHANETQLAQPLSVEKPRGPMMERFMASDRGVQRDA